MTDPENYGLADLQKAYRETLTAIDEMQDKPRMTRMGKKRLKKARKLASTAANLLNKAAILVAITE